MASSIALPARRLQTVRGAAGEDWWEMTTCEPAPHLRALVVSCTGWTEHASQLTRRREVPSPIVPFIIDFDTTYRLALPQPTLSRQAHSEQAHSKQALSREAPPHEARSAGPERWSIHRHGFVAGMHDIYAVTASQGTAHAIQVNFTPIGGYLFFRVPMSTLTNRTVTLDDLFGAEVTRLVDRLRHTTDWETRFTLVEQFITRRIDAARPATAAVRWAYAELERTAGRMDIGALTAELGCSRKHLIAQFHEQIGVAPKTMARILRFARAVRLLRQPTVTSGVDVALRCGYFDQAHLIKDFREFAGTTPTDFLRRCIPDLESVSD